MNVNNTNSGSSRSNPLWPEQGYCLTSNGSYLLNAGAGIYVQSGNVVLSNNSVVTTFGRGSIPTFRCLSGSARANVGNLISPLGDDITFSRSDPFTVRHGGSNDPGTLLVRSVRSLRREESGIYTYRTPDEKGNIVEFYVGLYHSNQSGIIANTIIVTKIVASSYNYIPSHRSCDFSNGGFPHQ